MWQDEDSSGQFLPDDQRPDEQPPSEFDAARQELNQQQAGGQGAGFPGHLFPAAALPHVVPVMDLYEVARARAMADQQLSKLFNPEYYI